MGRRPEPWASRMRPDWVYVGATEAAVLAGVSDHTIERWIAGAELEKLHVDGENRAGRPRNLYRLDKVLTLARRVRR